MASFSKPSAIELRCNNIDRAQHCDKIGELMTLEHFCKRAEVDE
jgi:hypothetical protein